MQGTHHNIWFVVEPVVILSLTGSKGKWLKSYLLLKFHHINKNGMVSI